MKRRRKNQRQIMRRSKKMRRSKRLKSRRLGSRRLRSRRLSRRKMHRGRANNRLRCRRQGKPSGKVRSAKTSMALTLE